MHERIVVLIVLVYDVRRVADSVVSCLVLELPILRVCTVVVTPIVASEGVGVVPEVGCVSCLDLVAVVYEVVVGEDVV